MGLQTAVARVDLFICQARASPLWALAAGLILGGLIYGIIKTKWRI